MVRGRGYPTPDTPSPIVFTTRCVPIPDIPEFIALIGGLLFEATRSSFWDELGTMSPQEAASLMAQTLALYDAEGECELDRTPVGAVVWYPSPTIPDKWHKCDGTELLKSTYEELYDLLPDFQAIQSGTGLDIIILPDLSDSFLYGANTNSEIADVGGEVNHQLTIAEIPAHAHSIDPHTHNLQRSTNGGGASIRLSAVTTSSAGANVTTDGGTLTTTLSKGDNGAHNNMPPYMRGYWLMKVSP